MRTYGRVANSDGSQTWIEISTDANGYNDGVFLTTLAQSIKLVLGESPFFANIGIPQQQTIMTQVYPDFYVNFIQQEFQQYFAALLISRISNSSPPTYKVKAVTHQGSIIDREIPT